MKKDNKQKPLNRYDINAAVFDQMLYDYRYVVVNRNLKYGIEDLMQELKDSRSNCHTVYYDSVNQIAIVNYLMLEGYDLIEQSDHYMKRCIIYRNENVDKDENIYVRPYARTAEKYITKILYAVGYTDEEIEECKNKCRIEGHAVPRHDDLPFYYDQNVIHRFENCVYYDINNAHLDALCEIFPKAKRKFIYLRKRINDYKAKGLVNKARWLKDIVNIYCGNLGKKNKDGTFAEDRQTYEWIVNRTRKKVDAAIEEVGGTLIYANTDGFMVHNPDKKLATSDKLGEFKSELSDTDNVIYVYVHTECKTDTGWKLYQYTNAKNKVEQKGNALEVLRTNIDLSIGQTIIYKKHIDSNNKTCYYDNLNIEIKEVQNHEGKS